MGEINFREEWEAHLPEFSALVQIPSVYDESSISPEAPYGKPVRAALDFMKALCQKEGFEIREYDGAAFSASWGSGERVDVASHLDVVNITDDWDEDPFSGSEHDGYIHGRGTQDMKSGAFLSFLALKLAKDSGIVPKREIRLVYGSDEERTMEDMRLYVQKAGLPSFAFTPDGVFPMAIGEKGALMWVIKGKLPDCIFSIDAGVQPNVIAPSAHAVLRYVNLSDVERASSELGIPVFVSGTEDALSVRTEGKAAHASRPEAGHSAISDLLRVLSFLTKDGLICRLADFFKDGYSSGTELECDLVPMGKLSLNLGVLTGAESTLTALVDCRYPYGVSSHSLTKAVERAFPELSVELPYDDPPTYSPPEDPYISLLLQAYSEAVGHEAIPYISGGVSYSKVFGHCVAFGSVGESSSPTMHQKNEKISEKDCISALEIYYRAIKKLAEAEL